MRKKITTKALPSIEAVEAEAARVESMIAATTNRITSSQCNLRTFMHLQVCKAELEAYLAGLLYGLGYTNLVDTNDMDSEFKLPEFGTIVANTFVPAAEEEEDVRYVQFYEC